MFQFCHVACLKCKCCGVRQQTAVCHTPVLNITKKTYNNRVAEIRNKVQKMSQEIDERVRGEGVDEIIHLIQVMNEKSLNTSVQMCKC